MYLISKWSWPQVKYFEIYSQTTTLPIVILEIIEYEINGTEIQSVESNRNILEIGITHSNGTVNGNQY